MKSHSFVQLAQGVRANSWWECPDWTLVSILCVCITADEKGKIKKKPHFIHWMFYPCLPIVTSFPHLTLITSQGSRHFPVPEKNPKNKLLLSLQPIQSTRDVR